MKGDGAAGGTAVEPKEGQTGAGQREPGGTMHIGVVVSGLGAGGAERVIALVTSHWAEAGHRITLFAFDAPDDPVFHPLHPAVNLVRLNLPPGASGPGAWLLMLRRILALRRAFRRHRPDALVSFLFKINVLTLLAAKGLGIPTAVSERNHPLLQPAAPIWRRLAGLTYPWARAIILQTHASIDAMPAALHARCRVIGNPISRFERMPEPSRRRVLSAVGRLAHQKGFDLLIDAFAQVAARHKCWTLEIWGEGPLRDTLERQVARLGLRGRVRLVGLSAGPEDWIAASSAFVMTSRYEGFANALAEAGAAGLPRLSTRFEFGAEEQIEDGFDGLLVPSGDVDALAAALDRLLGDRALRDRLGAAASESGRRFATDVVLHRWDELLPLLR